jgi:hypothetical protein
LISRARFEVRFCNVFNRWTENLRVDFKNLSCGNQYLIAAEKWRAEKFDYRWKFLFHALSHSNVDAFNTGLSNRLISAR